MFCNQCSDFFLPSLLIVEDHPIQECQFLCRIQVIDSIESWLLEVTGRLFLTRNPENRVRRGGYTRVLNDVSIEALAAKPTLLVNFLQYMETGPMISFLEGRNVANGDLLYQTVIAN